MTTRRDALKKLGAAAVASSAIASATSASASVTTPALSAAAAPPWRLFAPLGPGSELGGWTLRSLGSVADGAVVLGLEADGAVANVHLCARNGAPVGLASTEKFDLLLMNRGDGSTPSHEGLGRVVLTLARHVGANTDAALLEHPELKTLLTHDERVAAFDDCGREVLV